jgi:hypothetical protein
VFLPWHVLDVECNKTYIGQPAANDSPGEVRRRLVELAHQGVGIDLHEKLNAVEVILKFLKCPKQPTAF